ncbi:type IV pilin protein [Halomonas sp. CS7]|uniref:Type IV pilin protein n=1 Tax=Halomonas pelophila TaxID=3151122 RepID=A0ABV1NB99_9GAMM
MTFDTPQRRPRRLTEPTRPSAGFTLIELMIVVAVIAILASIAYPSYTRYVQEARRTDAMSALNSVAGQLERCYTVSSDYTDDGSGAACVTFPVTSDEEFYQVTASDGAGNGTVPGVSSYILKATPQAPQDTDSCGNFTLNHQGLRSPDGCW